MFYILGQWSPDIFTIQEPFPVNCTQLPLTQKVFRLTAILQTTPLNSVTETSSHVPLTSLMVFLHMLCWWYFCSAIKVCGLLMYIVDLRCSQREKSSGVRSGDLGCHFVGPCRSVQRLGRTSSSITTLFERYAPRSNMYDFLSTGWITSSHRT